jgi:mono/diheme cytochrome c family protein
MKQSLMAVAVSLTLAGPAYADEIADVWKAKCKSCHAEDGSGNTKVGKKEKVADLTDAGWQERHSDEKIKKVILEGSPDNKKMKPFKDKLTEAEVDGLVAYIRAMKK